MERKVNRIQTTKLAVEMNAAYYADLRRAPAEGRKIAWTCGPAPFELLRVMDIAIQHGESYGAYAAANKGNIELKQAAEADGYSPDGCSYWRTVNGLAIMTQRGSSLREEVRLPMPDFVMSCNVCQTMGLWSDSLGRLLNVPAFNIDVPVTYNDSLYQGNIAYVEEQLQDFIEFLEKVTGRRFDYDRLKEVVTLVKKAAKLRREALDMSKSRPSPMTFFDALLSLGPMHVLRGTNQSVNYFEKLKAEVTERVEHHVPAVSGEKYRLYWDHLPIWFKLGSLSEKLAGWNAVVLVGAYTHGGFYWEWDKIDPERPLYSIAEELVYSRRTQDTKFRVDMIAKLAKDFSLNGLIMHSSRTCRLFTFGQYDIVNAIRDRLGIPGVLIDGDPTDPNYYSEEQTNTRLQALIETIDAGKRSMAS